ncbi:MAG: hypothetical protein RMN51_13500 [Verrucomicrobiota bacterium]|nr:hypothetical protein [Verrucomicrobiota bacterium]
MKPTSNFDPIPTGKYLAIITELGGIVGLLPGGRGAGPQRLRGTAQAAFGHPRRPQEADRHRRDR